MSSRTFMTVVAAAGLAMTAAGQTGTPAASPAPDYDFNSAVKRFKDWTSGNGLVIASSTTDLNKASDPAKFSYFDSRVSDSAKLLDLGLKYQPLQLPPSLEDFAPALGIEYHLNSAKADTGRRKQDSAAVTGSFERIVNRGAGSVSPYYKGSLSYKNDRVDKGQGVTAALGLSLHSSAWHLNSFGLDTKAHYFWLWSPLVEIQREDKNGIEPAQKNPAVPVVALDGGVTRGKLSVATEYWPFAPSLEEIAQKKARRIQLQARYQLWDNTSRAGFFKTYPRYQRVVTASLNVYLDNTQSLCIGLDHSNGENPELDKPRDRTTELALKAKF